MAYHKDKGIDRAFVFQTRVIDTEFISGWNVEQSSCLVTIRMLAWNDQIAKK